MSIELDPSGAAESYGARAHQRVGFFTDTSVCIGCKACEVACKEWNALPADGVGDHGAAGDVLELTGMSYDNTGGLGASTYRHVAFVEQTVPAARSNVVELGMPATTLPGDTAR